MKKNLLVLICFGFIFTINAQNPITLNLPNPCSITNINEPSARPTATIDFTVSPNPNQGSFVIEISALKTIGSFEILISNMQGKSLFNEQLYSSNKTCVKTINISHLTDGIYSITLIGNKEKISKKIIVHKNQ